MIDHLIFDNQKYYPIDNNTVELKANGKTYREYKFQTIVKTFTGSDLVHDNGQKFK